MNRIIMTTTCIIYFLFITVIDLCIDDLSIRKVATQSTTYPGPYDSYKADNAVDRDITTCMRADGIGPRSPYQTVWWRVDLGEVYNIYSVNILFKNYDGYEIRQRGRFAGFSLHVSNSGTKNGSSHCYKDGPQLPPLNFTTICTLSGRYVIFYNERLDGVTYPEEYVLNGIVYMELCEVIVNGCSKPGVYGSNCDAPCPINCRYNTCHILNGTCFECEPGWTGPICNKKCAVGRYGHDCKEQCSGHCRNNASCNHVSGHCDGGCAAGWRGSFCTNGCAIGTFGYDCANNCSGNCLNDSPCNKQTGNCKEGCKPGYTNNFCSEKCPSGYSGSECRNKCSGNCLYNETCHHVDGVCTSGCQNGYMEKWCNKSCPDKHYGPNCSRACSPNCKTCNPTDGKCSCYAGWKEPNCTIACTKSYGENCQSPCSRLCINQTCNRFNGSCPTVCKNVSSGENCNPEFKTHQKRASDIAPVVVGVVLSACIILIIVIVAFLIRFKRKSMEMSRKRPFDLKVKQPLSMRNLQRQDPTDYDSSHDDYPDEPDDSAPVLPERNMRGPPTNKNIPVRNIKAQIANMSAKENAGFKFEYNDIPRGELCPCLEAKKPENKVKNRYVTIFPYDHSRVLLGFSVNEETGYINANYIEDTQGKRSYIATQGPKPKTIADFWTMISQEDVFVIVCLTNLKEGAKNKCAQYWPNVNDKLQGGNITVRNLGEKTYAEHIIRQFKIHNKTKKEDRLVTMYHYTAWADHGVADPLSLVVFHRQVMRATAQSAGKYTLVHCSAGVGRTGTYIALDALYREGQKTGKINVPMYVRTMRKDRMNMIQGDDQYKLLYLALMEAFNGPSRCVSTEKFLSKYQEENCYTNRRNARPKATQKCTLENEFEELLSLRKVYSKKDYESGNTHLTANYTQTVLPVDEYLCHLSYTKGRNTYYNAVLLQTFLEKDCVISAQYPLPDYTEDLLRLIRDFNASIVVFLCPLKDLASSTIWFPTKTQVKFVGNFTIKHVTEAKGSNVTVTRLIIQAKENADMRITVLECPIWKERQITADKRVLLDVIKEVKTEKINTEGRVLVLSSDGATRCGPFCVVYNAFEQITVDREVDIFTIARQLQVRRTEFISSLNEYQLCHDAIGEYLLNDCVYGNA